MSEVIRKDFIITPYEPVEYMPHWIKQRGSTPCLLDNERMVHLLNAYWIGQMPALRYRDRLFRFVDRLMEEEGTKTKIEFLADDEMMEHGSPGSDLTLVRTNHRYSVVDLNVGNLADQQPLSDPTFLHDDGLLNRLRGLDRNTRELALTLYPNSDITLAFPKFTSTVFGINRYLFGSNNQEPVYEDIRRGNIDTIARYQHSMALWMIVNAPTIEATDRFKDLAETMVKTYIAEANNINKTKIPARAVYLYR